MNCDKDFPRVRCQFVGPVSYASWQEERRGEVSATVGYTKTRRVLAHTSGFDGTPVRRNCAPVVIRASEAEHRWFR